MSAPNTFIIQRKALARLRKSMPFLSHIPDEIYHTLDTSEFYEPHGEIEQARQELETKLDHHVMTYKRGVSRTDIPWDKHLCANIEGADLTPDQNKILSSYEKQFREKGISFVVYKKPLTVKKQKHLFAQCNTHKEILSGSL